MEQATPPAAGVDLSPAGTDLGRVHFLPCGIGQSSAASVTDYFKPRDTGVEMEGLRVEEAFFRRRKLQGATAALPDGYRDYVLEKESDSSCAASAVDTAAPDVSAAFKTWMAQEALAVKDELLQKTAKKIEEDEATVGALSVELAEHKALVGKLQERLSISESDMLNLDAELEAERKRSAKLSTLCLDVEITRRTLCDAAGDLSEALGASPGPFEASIDGDDEALQRLAWATSTCTAARARFGQVWAQAAAELLLSCEDQAGHGVDEIFSADS